MIKIRNTRLVLGAAIAKIVVGRQVRAYRYRMLVQCVVIETCVVIERATGLRILLLWSSGGTSQKGSWDGPLHKIILFRKYFRSLANYVSVAS
jgi:hypothetical protein